MVCIAVIAASLLELAVDEGHGGTTSVEEKLLVLRGCCWCSLGAAGVAVGGKKREGRLCWLAFAVGAGVLSTPREMEG